MSILSWIGRKFGLTDTAFWRQWAGNDVWSGEPVNVETAMSVGAFWACTRLVSGVLSLPVNLYRRKSDNSRELVADHRAYQLLHNTPNGRQTPTEFLEGMGASLCVYGDAFAEKIMIGGEIAALDPLEYEHVIVERTRPGGVLQYRYRDPIKSTERVITPDNMLHVKGFGFGGDRGLSVLGFARQSLGNARAIERSAASTFANGMRPSGWLMYKGGTLSQPQRDQARKTLIDPMTGSENAGKIGILEADFDYKQMTMNPEDAQMLESRQFTVEDICRWFGVPPVLVGHAAQGQTMWGSGIEQILLGWLTLGAMPWLRRTTASFKRSLLTADERLDHYFEYDVEEMLAADSAARSELHSKYAQNGVMTRNEIRAKINLPKKPGGDLLTVQVNLTPLEKMQKDLDNPQPVPAQLPPPAPAAGEEEPEEPAGQRSLRVIRGDK